MNNVESTYMLTAEVAELIRTPVDTLRKWRMNQVGPPAIKVGRKLLYKRSDVVAWLEAQAEEQAKAKSA